MEVRVEDGGEWLDESMYTVIHSLTGTLSIRMH